MEKKKLNDGVRVARIRQAQAPKKPVDPDEFKKILTLRRSNRIIREVTVPTYSYIYDPEVQDKKYLKDLTLIENRLTDLGLHGRIHRLSRFKNLKEIIEDDVKSGAKTVVIFGNDETIRKALGICPGKELTFAIIPFGEKNTIAKLLGVGDCFEACQALSARLTYSIDLGVSNGQFFFSSLKIPHCKAEIICDGNFAVSAYQDRDIEILNFHVPKNEDDKLDFTPNPTDGELDLVVRKFNKLSIFGGWRHMFSRVGRDSVFFFKEANVVSRDQVTMFLDGRKTYQQNPKIEVIPNALKLIVGKNRLI